MVGSTGPALYFAKLNSNSISQHILLSTELRCFVSKIFMFILFSYVFKAFDFCFQSLQVRMVTFRPGGHIESQVEGALGGWRDDGPKQNHLRCFDLHM